jgi:hypothetical protein
MRYYQASNSTTTTTKKCGLGVHTRHLVTKRGRWKEGAKIPIGETKKRNYGDGN